MMRTVLAILAAIALLGSLTTAAFAWPGGIEGNPGLTTGSPEGYYLWHDTDGLHLRTHGPDGEHRFTARLQSDGTFSDIDTIRLEEGDRYEVLDGGHTLALQFHTFNYTDGVNFRVNGGDRLRLTLYLDGSLISTDQIYLGSLQVHPPSNPFTVRR